MDSQDPEVLPARTARIPLPNAAALWRWTKLASGPTAVSLALALITLGTNALIFRWFSPHDAGQFALLLAVSQTAALVTGLGQSAVIRRCYSRQAPGYYHWPRDLTQSLTLAAPLAILASLSAQPIYGFPAGQSLFVALAIIGLNLHMLLSSALSSHQHYIWSNVALRLPFNLLLLAMLPVQFLPVLHRLNYLLVAYVAASGLAGLIQSGVTRRLVPAGAGRLAPADRWSGAAFVVAALSHQLPEEGLFSLAGLFVGAEHLAAVAAFALFLRPFGLMYDVFSQILITELARRKNARLREMAVALFGLAGGLGTLAGLAMPLAANWLYAGRYDAYRHLIPWLAGGAALQLAEVLARTYITTLASYRALNQFATLQILVALFGIGVSIVLIMRWGVLGLAIGIFTIYLVRNLISYGFAFQQHRHKF